ncbi:MAG TPA: hypothetical protein PLI19_04485 [Erysipelotrichaceae bacterium]|nr:hypothetical protein [Erysipelotrichaceae bacterium]
MMISNIRRIYFNHRVARGWSYSIEIKKDGESYYLRTRFDDPENSYQPTDLIWQGETYKEILKSFFERIIDLFDNNDVLSWNGFDEYDPQTKDGQGFELQINFENGECLKADGENSFPEKYYEVSKEFYKMVNEIISIYHEQNSAKII